MSDSDNDSGSEAPNPIPANAQGAAALAGGGGAAQHPLWAASAGGGHQSTRGAPVGGRSGGRGGGRGRGTGAGSAAGSDDGRGARFEAISFLGLELQARQSAEGVGSSICSEDAPAREEPYSSSKKPLPRGFNRKKRAVDRDRQNSRELEDADAASELASQLGSDDDNEEYTGAPKGACPASDADLIARAAFGAAAAPSDDGVMSEADSQTPSERQRAAHKRAFPVKGITCVGCALPTRIRPVEEFVLNNFEKMKEDACYKLAALTYVRQVVEPARNEGVEVPNWSWKDCQIHFERHANLNLIQQVKKQRILSAMRETAASQLMRVESSGERQLDRANSDLMLKILAAEEKLDSSRVTQAGKQGAKPGAASGAGGAGRSAASRA